MQPNTLPYIHEGLSKHQIHQMAYSLVDDVLEQGHVFTVAEAIAAMDEFVKNVRKDERFVSYLRDELHKHHGRLKTPSGAQLETCEAGISYNYTHDDTWNTLDEEIKQLQALKKEREEKLRKIAPGKLGVDEETGEVLEGAQKTSKSTYRITLTK